MSIEFDLLYRWHALVPEHVEVHGRRRPMADLLWDNDVVTQHGVADLFAEASGQPSAEMGLRNTPAFLWDIERTTIAILPWLVPLLVSLVIITYLPKTVLWLPKLFY